MRGFGSPCRQAGAAPLWAVAILAGLLLGLPLGAQVEKEQSVDAGDQETGLISPDSGQAPPGTDEEPATRPVIDRITFQIPFPAERGGGTATGSAGNVEYLREDYVVATLGVEFRYQDMTFQGDRIEVDLNTKKLFAEGDVIVDQGPRRLAGESLTFDLETKTGEVTNGKAFVDPDIYFEGRTITKVGEETYRVAKGTLTSCTADSPGWSFRLTHAQIRLEGFARVRNATFRVKKLPLLYFPYILYPAKTERTSGFLFPNFGYSQLRGANLGLAYFQTLGNSADTTFFFDAYDNEFLGFGNEVRYNPTPGTLGLFEAYGIEDPIEDEVRWKISWNHTSENLPLGLRAVLSYQNFSDFNFFRDFERDFSRVSTRQIRSAGFLSGNWGQHSLNLLVEQNETFRSETSSVALRQLPEAEYRLRATQIWKLPLYIELLSSASYFSTERSGVEASWSRVDLAPQLSASLSTLPWLSAKLSVAERVTWYSESVAEDGSVSGESLTRTLASASANIVGPSFSRVFDMKAGKFGRFKHIIEPRWSYLRVDDFEDQSLVPLFDQVDRVRGADIFSWALVNRLLAKPQDEDLHGGAREILSFEINQSISLDKARPFPQGGGRTSSRGPMTARLRFNPGPDVRLETRVSYNTLFGRLNSTSLSGGLSFGSQAEGTSWTTNLNRFR